MRNLPKYMVFQDNMFKSDYDQASETSASHSVLRLSLPFSLHIDSEINIWTEINKRNENQTTKLNTFNLWHSRM